MNSPLSSSTSPCNSQILKLASRPTSFRLSLLCNTITAQYTGRNSLSLKLRASNNANEVDSQTAKDDQAAETSNQVSSSSSSAPPALDRDLKKVVQKTAATFAPRASTATRNPAVPGTTLYTVFEVQGYVSMVLGGALSFNLIFPSNDPDIWRLMGMWSIWMFTIPSLRARDCSKNEKEALNYLFLLIPLLNVLIPLLFEVLFICVVCRYHRLLWNVCVEAGMAPENRVAGNSTFLPFLCLDR
ncbi:PROTEIN RESISTANCE TO PHYTOPHTHORA 1 CHLOROPLASTIC [Salix koriyanagi]|uniref:PROTEIN RESISTANCE TO PHYTOPHTHORA 1 CHLOROPLASTIC n=1 Tax=Salix koriyanagi TaxID=2511006 RepID=A0A9Q0Z729_9ROSI|nr:PROTEIN RESISTANCE TO PHYTOPHTHORA 1 CHLOROPLASTIC [Salix koriyanagi]